jgi:Domain of unknown function (DUF4145)
MVFQGHGNVGRPGGQTSESWTPLDCAHCGRRVSGAVIAVAAVPGIGSLSCVQCPNCGWGSLQQPGGAIEPGVRYGPVVEGLPPEVERAYEEARACMSVNANTAAELVCRGILMHVATDKGAKPGLSFEKYLDHLSASGYITPPMRPWTDRIRRHGNAAAHQLEPVPRERAEDTIEYTAQLLRLVYEMDARAQRFAAP